MADILNQALKDANYGVSGKNANPKIFYTITAYSFTRPDPISDDIEYSVTVAAFMNSGGSMGSGTPLDLKIQLSVLNNGIIFDKYIKQSVSWSGRGDSTATATVTFTGHTNLVAEGTQTVKLIGYRPNQTGDVISSSNSAPGKTIGSGEVVNSSYTMNFPAKSIEPDPTPDPEPEEQFNYHVNIDNNWTPCAVKVCIIGEGYVFLGYATDFSDLQDFDMMMYERYGIYGLDLDVAVVQSDTDLDRPGPHAGLEVIAEWGPDSAPWEIYMKSDNVKQWVDCTIQSLEL